jgi:hypothetical protein
MLTKIENAIDKMSHLYSMKDLELEIKVKTSNNIKSKKFNEILLDKLNRFLTKRQKKLFDYENEKNDIKIIVSFHEFNNVKKNKNENQIKMIL